MVKAKYQSVLDLGQELNIQNGDVSEENGKLKKWLDDLFQIAKVNKREIIYDDKSPVVSTNNTNHKEINLLANERIDDDFSTKSAQVLNKPHTSTNMPQK